MPKTLYRVGLFFKGRAVVTRFVRAESAKAAAGNVLYSLPPKTLYDRMRVEVIDGEAPRGWVDMSRDEVLKDLASVLPPRR